MDSDSVINQAKMKQQNKKKVMYTLWKNAPTSRTALAGATGLNKATITGIVNSLEEEGIAIPSGSVQGGIGRARSLLTFNENYGLCAAIIFRAQVMKVAISNTSAKILWSGNVEFSSSESPISVLTHVADLLEQGLKECSTYSGNLIGIGVGTASLLRPEDNVLYAIHSINWRNVPIVEYLQHRFHVPIAVDTASNNAVIGEKLMGIAKNTDNVVYLSVGYGIGAGILINGVLYRGAGGFAGDVGHFVIDPSGPPCPCGKRGCWEVMASSISAGKSFPELREAADRGDREAISTLARIGRNLGIGIANLIHVLNPSLVIIGGGAVSGGDWIMSTCRNAVQERTWPLVWERTRIEFSGLGNQADLIGTVTRVIELMFQ